MAVSGFDVGNSWPPANHGFGGEHSESVLEIPHRPLPVGGRHLRLDEDEDEDEDIRGDGILEEYQGLRMPPWKRMHYSCSGVVSPRERSPVLFPMELEGEGGVPPEKGADEDEEAADQRLVREEQQRRDLSPGLRQNRRPDLLVTLIRARQREVEASQGLGPSHSYPPG